METTITHLPGEIYMIEQEMVRAYLIVGGKKALLLDALAAPCDLMGLVRSVTDKPLYFCLTHADPDHTANAAAFPVHYLHAEEKAFYTPPEGCMTMTLRDGDHFDLGGLDIDVVHLPGHTPGSIALADRMRKLLFVGDTVSRAPVYMFGEKRNMELYITSLRHLQVMADFRAFQVLLPSHGPMPVYPEEIDELLKCALDIQEGYLVGQETDMPGRGGPAPLLAKRGEVGILYQPKK